MMAVADHDLSETRHKDSLATAKRGSIDCDEGAERFEFVDKTPKENASLFELQMKQNVCADGLLPRPAHLTPLWAIKRTRKNKRPKTNKG